MQVPNNHVLAQNLHYIYHYPKPKYRIAGYLDPKPYRSLKEDLIIGYLDPLGEMTLRMPIPSACKVLEKESEELVMQWKWGHPVAIKWSPLVRLGG